MLGSPQLVNQGGFSEITNIAAHPSEFSDPNLSQDTISGLDRIAREISSRLGIGSPQALIQRTGRMISSFRRIEGLKAFSNTEDVIMAALIIELRRVGQPIILEHLMQADNRRIKSVKRLIARITRSLSIDLDPISPEIVVAETWSKLASGIPDLMQYRGNEELVSQLFTLCKDNEVLPQSPSDLPGVLACCFYVIKARIPSIHLRECIRLIGLEKSEKVCYRDHANVKAFMERSTRYKPGEDIGDLVGRIHEETARRKIQRRLVHS